MLILAHFGVGLGVIEIGVGVEHAQHARDSAVVDGRIGLVALDGIRVVLLDDGVYVGERLQAVAELALILGRLRADTALQHAADDGAHREEENHCKEGTPSAGSHKFEEPPDGN